MLMLYESYVDAMWMSGECYAMKKNMWMQCECECDNRTEYQKLDESWFDKIIWSQIN